MGFWGPWRHSIGSIHLINRAVTAIKIAENVVGFGKLTTGLQGSLITTGIGIEFGRAGSITTYQWPSHTIGSIKPTSGEGIVFLPDKNHLVITNLVNQYLIEYGTTTGNKVGSIKPSVLNFAFGLTLATDKHRYLIADQNYVKMIGTTTGNAQGSFAATANLRGVAFDNGNHRVWTSDELSGYLYKYGTTTGNKLGSIKIPVALVHGLALAPDTHHLWYLDYNNNYTVEVGTVNGNLIGSIKTISLAANRRLTTFSTDKGRMWIQSESIYAIEIGTAFGRGHSGTYVKFSAPFLSPPSVSLGQIDDLGNKSVFTMNPASGSFWLKAGTYPAKANWIAVGV